MATPSVLEFLKGCSGVEEVVLVRTSQAIHVAVRFPDDRDAQAAVKVGEGLLPGARPSTVEAIDPSDIVSLREASGACHWQRPSALAARPLVQLGQVPAASSTASPPGLLQPAQQPFAAQLAEVAKRRRAQKPLAQVPLASPATSVPESHPVVASLAEQAVEACPATVQPPVVGTQLGAEQQEPQAPPSQLPQSSHHPVAAPSADSVEVKATAETTRKPDSPRQGDKQDAACGLKPEDFSTQEAIRRYLQELLATDSCKCFRLSSGNILQWLPAKLASEHSKLRKVFKKNSKRPHSERLGRLATPSEINDMGVFVKAVFDLKFNQVSDISRRDWVQALIDEMVQEARSRKRTKTETKTEI